YSKGPTGEHLFHVAVRAQHTGLPDNQLLPGQEAQRAYPVTFCRSCPSACRTGLCQPEGTVHRRNEDRIGSRSLHFCMEGLGGKEQGETGSKDKQRAV